MTTPTSTLVLTVEFTKDISYSIEVSCIYPSGSPVYSLGISDPDGILNIYDNSSYSSFVIQVNTSHLASTWLDPDYYYTTANSIKAINGSTTG